MKHFVAAAVATVLAIIVLRWGMGRGLRASSQGGTTPDAAAPPAIASGGNRVPQATPDESAAGAQWQVEAVETARRLLDAAEQGAPDLYASLLGGELATRFREMIRQHGRKTVAEQLRRTQAGVVGIGIPSTERLSERRCRVIVDYQYRDRKERQVLELRLEGGTWRVVAIGLRRHVKQKIPWGTPIELIEP